MASGELTEKGRCCAVAEFIKETFPELFSMGAVIQLGRIVLRVIIIIALARLAVSFATKAIARFFAVRSKGTRFHHMDEKRAKTISSLVQSIGFYAIYFIAAIMLLDSFGINTGSLLATAGIAGLAIGFGAQNLVKDVVSGFFILFEGQFQVGDYVTVAGISGTVEYTGLRTTWVRAFGGELEIIPNGEMRKVTNHMGPQMRVLVYLSIAHDEDVDRATKVLTDGFNIAKEQGALAEITEGPRVLGVSDVTDSGVQLLLWARANTMQQWGMGRELRALAKRLLDENGIKLGYMQRRLIVDRSPIAIEQAIAEQQEEDAGDELDEPVVDEGKSGSDGVVGI